MTDTVALSHIKQIARTIAVAQGLTDAFDELMTAEENADVYALDAILDRLVPTTGGFGATFLPSFAMAATEPLMRSRNSWRRLRDRVFANMDECKRIVAESATVEVREQLKPTFAEWDRENARYRPELDGRPYAN